MKDGSPIFAPICACPAILSGLLPRANENTSEERIPKSRRVFVPYSSNGVYDAAFESSGKEIRRSLRNTDRTSAQRALTWLKQEREQVDPTQGKLTLAELSDRYAATIQHQAPKTIERKLLIIHRIKSHWPTGRLTQIAKIRPSEVDLWLSRYHFGSASRNLFISCIKEIFALALRDRIIASSPAAHLRYAKREKPIRPTPTHEQFKAIIADVRAQPFNADAQDSADFLEFLGLAGLGQAEARSLTRSDIDFDAGRLVTFRQKTSTGFAVPIFPQLRRLLERLCGGKANGDPVLKI